MALSKRFTEWIAALLERTAHLQERYRFYPYELAVVNAVNDGRIVRDALPISKSDAADWSEFRFRHILVWERRILAVCATEKTAQAVKQALAPTYGSIHQVVCALDFAIDIETIPTIPIDPNPAR